MTRNQQIAEFALKWHEDNGIEIETAHAVMTAEQSAKFATDSQAFLATLN